MQAGYRQASLALLRSRLNTGDSYDDGQDSMTLLLGVKSSAMGNTNGQACVHARVSWYDSANSGLLTFVQKAESTGQQPVG